MLGHVHRNMSTCVDGKKVTIMNDLPTPCGDWNTYNSKKQSKNNLVLIFGITSVIVSFIVAYQMDVLELNYYPPERPADRDEKK